MHRVYEIFEVWPDGSTVKRAVVSGLEFAKVTLDALAERTSHECKAVDAETRQVVAQRNVPRAKARAAKRIFQIAYDERSQNARLESTSPANDRCRLQRNTEWSRDLATDCQQCLDLFIPESQV